VSAGLLRISSGGPDLDQQSVFQDGDTIPQAQGLICERCRKDRACTGLHDGMQLIYPRVLASQGLILVSPTHNYNITAWMKAFIDRLYCFYIFENTRPRAWASRLAHQGRKAAIVAICEQDDPRDMGWPLEAMRLPLEALGFEIVGELSVLGVFDKGGITTQQDTIVQARRLAATLARSLTSESS
jgi:multimeric flavodoxin WrbA